MHRYHSTGLLVIWLGLLVFFAVSAPAFRSPVNFLDQSRSWLEVGILASAMAPVILAGGIDLSVAAMVALVGVSVVRLHFDAGIPIFWAASLGILVGCVGGAVNGLLIVLGRIPDLIVTLATMVMFRGLAEMVLSHQVLSGLPESYRQLGSGTLLGFLPPAWLVLLASWLAMFVFLHRLRPGRYAYAVGSAPTAARFAAVPTASLRVLLYTLSGFAAAVAAVVHTARNDTAKSDDALGLELEVIACVVLGGVSITGGRGTAVGVILGVLIIGTLRSGFQLAGLDELYQKMSIGGILIAAAILNTWLARVSHSAAPSGKSLGGERQP